MDKKTAKATKAAHREACACPRCRYRRRRAAGGTLAQVTRVEPEVAQAPSVARDDGVARRAKEVWDKNVREGRELGRKKREAREHGVERDMQRPEPAQHAPSSSPSSSTTTRPPSGAGGKKFSPLSRAAPDRAAPPVNPYESCPSCGRRWLISESTWRRSGHAAQQRDDPSRSDSERAQAAKCRAWAASGSVPVDDAGAVLEAGERHRVVLDRERQRLAERDKLLSGAPAPAAPDTRASAPPPVSIEVAAQENSPGDRLNADLDVGASGRVEGRPQVPEAERELVAPSLALRCRRCDRVVPAPERPGHAAWCHVGYDEHEARRWGPI